MRPFRATSLYSLVLILSASGLSRLQAQHQALADLARYPAASPMSLQQPSGFFNRGTAALLYHALRNDSTASKGRGRWMVTGGNAVSYQALFPFYQPDGGLAPVRGLASSWNAGILYALPWLRIYAAPVLYYHRAVDYDSVSSFLRTNPSWRLRMQYVDFPGRMPARDLNRITAGNSQLQVVAGPFTAGVTHAPEMWGPGRFSSLLLSDNTDGFWHAFAGTDRPVKTFAGRFEARLIAGRLYPSRQAGFRQKSQWRYVNGASFIWSPPGLKDLRLGGSRVFQVQQDDFGGSTADYFPVFQAFLKKTIAESSGNLGEDETDQMAAVFFHWNHRPSRSAFYAEFVRSDHSWDYKDLIVQPEHSSGYMAGVTTAPAALARYQVRITVERYKTSRTNTYVSRPFPDLYLHHLATEGWTNRGQLLGPFVPPGSDVNMARFEGSAGRYRIGLHLQSIWMGRSFYNAEPAFSNKKLYAPWTDHSAKFQVQGRFGPMSVFASVNAVRSLNRHYKSGNDHTSPGFELAVQYGL